MAGKLSPGEEAQLAQTIEMFEVITQSQPNDYQSLEILKEAYAKLGREIDVLNTSKRIAQAYVQMGQLSSAILEYETILQRYPDDPDVQGALAQIESKSSHFPGEASGEAPAASPLEAPAAPGPAQVAKRPTRALGRDNDDGRQTMYRLFVEAKIITAVDFDLCWPMTDPAAPLTGAVEPFVKVLADKGLLPIEKSLKLLADKSRAAFLPLELYDVDLELARRFPAPVCQRWCILPFDRMSKCVLVATANPFNQLAARELAEATPNRLQWYLAPPAEIMSNLRKAFR